VCRNIDLIPVGFSLPGIDTPPPTGGQLLGVCLITSGHAWQQSMPEGC
jgi:hypothetical protein